MIRYWFSLGLAAILIAIYLCWHYPTMNIAIPPFTSAASATSITEPLDGELLTIEGQKFRVH